MLDVNQMPDISGINFRTCT